MVDHFRGVVIGKHRIAQTSVSHFSCSAAFSFQPVVLTQCNGLGCMFVMLFQTKKEDSDNVISKMSIGPEACCKTS